MNPAADQARLEARFEEELAADAWWRTFFNRGAWVMALSAVGTFLLLIMPLHRNGPALIFLSMYSPFTRILSMVAWKAFLYPRFALRLDDADPAVAAAARAVLDRHRDDVVERILVDEMLPSKPSDVAAFDPAELARLARKHDVEWWRRTGRVVLLVWSLLSVALWGTLVATGGGRRTEAGVVSDLVSRPELGR